MKPEKGYVVEDSVVLEVEIEVDPPKKTDLNHTSPNLYTSPISKIQLMNKKLEDASISLAADFSSKVILSEKNRNKSSY